MTTPGASELDVAIVGDGPAGAAIAHACDATELRVRVFGSGRRWTNTYGAWVDEVPTLPDSVWASTLDRVIVGAARLHRVDRAYGVLDNHALRAHLSLAGHLQTAHVDRISDRGGHTEVVTATGDVVRARWVIDARGADPSLARAWQTGYGVVIDEAHAQDIAATDAATLMDWSWSGSYRVPSFLYVIPYRGRWMVEHTVLAARPGVDPTELRPALLDRLGRDVVAEAEAAGDVERVRIPMGVPPSSGSGRIVRFGGAAGFAHPATGYSVAASLTAAPRVARAIAAGAGAADVHAAVWPAAVSRARRLHDVGLDALLRLDANETAAFFEAFFALPPEVWSRYMRSDGDPGEVARAMVAVFRRSPWSVRRRLARPDRRLVAALPGRSRRGRARLHR